MKDLQTIPVLVAPQFDPGTGRIELAMPEGSTLAEIVAASLPGASPADLTQARVTLIDDHGMAEVDPRYWRSLRPKPGVRIVIRMIAAGDSLRDVLTIVIAIAAVASGQIWGLQVGGLMGLGTGAVAAAVGGAVVGLGVTVVGTLLVNALIPPVRPDSMDRKERYSISGWQNRVDPNGAIPEVLGTLRIAPPFATRSHSEIVGDWQYVRALFVAGHGEVELTDFRLGQTSIANYDHIEVEVRSGLASDLPISLFPRQIAEESVGTELTRLRPRDEMGEVEQVEVPLGNRVRYVDAPGEETPITRTTGADASGASVLLSWPAGLFRMNDEGKRRDTSVSVRIQQRRVGAQQWQLVTTLDMTARRLESFYRQHTWDFPARGRWQVRLTMMTDENLDSQVQDRTVWAALQTLRPEYPLNVSQPLALVALRIKATHQLNGNLDNFNMLASRIVLDWDAATGAWVRRASSNPAAIFRHVLQSPANPKPVADSGVDLQLLQDWHEFCAAKGLKYDRFLEEAGTTLRDVLTEIALAGRATPRHDGLRWGVVIDRPQELAVDHISPRNSWAFAARRTYVTPPDGFRIAFQDASNDYAPAERLVRWPGHVGEIVLTEALELPGKTDPDEVYREGLRRAYEVLHRPDSYEVTQDGAVRVATRGDLVMLSHDVLDVVQVAARVKATSGFLIELDEEVEIEDGQAYAIRFRRFDEDDPIGTSVVLPVEAEAGFTRVLNASADDLPLPGDLVHFGVLGRESFQSVVTGIEATEDMASLIRLVDASPQIDALTDAAEIPEWSGRVGVEIDPATLLPAVPRFTSVKSGVEGTDQAGLIRYLIEPGSGTVPTATFTVQHRRPNEADWQNVTIPVANGGGTITRYANGEAVELRATATSTLGTVSASSATIAFTVGGNDAAIPSALEAEGISVTTLLGGALIQLATGADAATAKVQLYRSTAATLDRSTDAVGEALPVAPQQTFSFSIGDVTRTNLIDNGQFTSAAGWTVDAGWAISGGAARHTPGSYGDVSQSLQLTAGRWYRVGYTVARTAGSVLPILRGGSDRNGTSRVTSGVFSDRLQAVTGNDRLSFRGWTAFDGTIDNVVAYLETAACLAQGTHYLWLEPQNADGVPGPVAGPFSISIT